MTLWFVLGTAAELIKIYPLIKATEARGLRWKAISTGQSPVALFKQAADFGLLEGHFLQPVQTESDLSTSKQALRWFLKAWWSNPSQWFNGEEQKSFFIVHGDTLSALVGAGWGNRVKAKVVHIEAGLRSPRLFSPFPEEINRRLVSRRALLHMAPDEVACENLRRSGCKKGIVNTGGNTLADTLRAVGAESARTMSYALVNIHRYENLSSKEKWDHILKVIRATVKHHPVTWVLHPQTRVKLEQDGSMAEFTSLGVQFLDRLPFTVFIKLLGEAAFVISDGGSNQEECFYLGKPCLILRDETERREGLGQSCVLARFDNETIHSFLYAPEIFQQPPKWPERSPSEVIMDAIEDAASQD